MPYIEEPKELNLEIYDGVNFGIDLSNIVINESIFDFTDYTITMSIAAGRRVSASDALLTFSGDKWTVGSGFIRLEVKAADVSISPGLYFYDITAKKDNDVLILAEGSIVAKDVLSV